MIYWNSMKRLKWLLVGGGRAAADHFQRPLHTISRQKFQITLFSRALNHPQYIYSYRECSIKKTRAQHYFFPIFVYIPKYFCP